MSTELVTALIAAGVSLFTSLIAGSLTYQQIKRERAKWLFDLKVSFSSELYKARMIEYSKMMETLYSLSRRAKTKLTPGDAHRIAEEINQWMYGAGGLYASARTRKAGYDARDTLLAWNEGDFPRSIIDTRESLIWSMKEDLDIPFGSRKAEFPREPILTLLQDEMKTIEKQRSKPKSNKQA